MAGGSDGLVATWNRIEGSPAQLDATVLATSDMSAQTLIAYRALKARWDASAEHRQSVLQVWPPWSGAPVSSIARLTQRWRRSSADPRSGPSVCRRVAVMILGRGRMRVAGWTGARAGRVGPGSGGRACAAGGRIGRMSSSNLLGPPPVHLPVDPAAAELAAGEAADQVVRRRPVSSLAWAVLAEAALDRGDDVAAYAYARVGYHRGLDVLRRNGWKGAGPIPWTHEPNQGFLRALSAFGQAAALFEEDDEVARVQAFLHRRRPADPGRASPLRRAVRAVRGPAAAARCACRTSSGPSGAGM